MNQAEEESKGLDLNGSSLINPKITEYPIFRPKVKIGVLASGNGSNFEHLIKSINSKRLNGEICVLIVNNPDCLAIKRAQKYNVPFKIINHKDCSSRNEHDQLVLRELESYSVEIVVMAGWMRIVGNSLINKYKNRLLNIHPSLLPSFKGIDAIQQAIDNKVSITGCTAHYVQKEVDSGSIIIQGAVPISIDEDKEIIKKRIQDIEHIILPFAVALVAKSIRKNVIDKDIN